MNGKNGKFVYIGLGLGLLTVICGVCGYMLIEGANFVDSLYMTIITVTTVGFGEVVPLSQTGKVFTVFLIVIGTGTAAYTASQFIDYVIAGELGKVFGRKRMQKDISKLRDHYIICGFGRMGKVICETLAKNSVPFVVLDLDENLHEYMAEHKYFYINGDATKEEELINAGILDAKGLITVVDSDVKNLFIVVTAKGMNKSLYVVSKAADESSHSKLFWAGADKVVSPYTIGGLSIANSIVKPSVTEFIDLAMGNKDFNIEVEEVLIDEGTMFDGISIKDTNIRKLGLIIIAIKKSTRAFMYNPGPETVINAGDRLICLGRKIDFDSLNKALNKKR